MTSVTDFNNFGDELGSLFKMFGAKSEAKEKTAQAEAEGKALGSLAWYNRGQKEVKNSPLTELLGAGIAGRSSSSMMLWISLAAMIAGVAILFYFLNKPQKNAA